VKNPIKVPNSVFYLGLVGVLSYVFSTVFGAIYSFNTYENTFLDFSFDFGAPMHRSLAGDIDPIVGEVMEAAVKVGLIVGLVFSAIYISIFLAFLIRGRTHPLNKPVFVVYLVFSSIGLFGHLVSIPSLLLFTAEPAFYIPFYYMGELFGFVATVSIFISCIMFIALHRKANPPQPVPPPGYYYNAAYGQAYPPYGQAYPPYTGPQPVAPPPQAAAPQPAQPVQSGEEDNGEPCAVCGRIRSADAAFCPHCGAPKA